jgi:hypothetical protein
LFKAQAIQKNFFNNFYNDSIAKKLFVLIRRYTEGELYQKFGFFFLLLTAFFIPIRLTPSLISLSLLLVLYLPNALKYSTLTISFYFPFIMAGNKPQEVKAEKEKRKNEPYITYFYFFIFSAFICGLVGIDPIKSIKGILSLLLSSLLIFVTRDLCTKHGTLHVFGALLIGQIFASTMTYLLKLFSITSPQFFHGEVTQSGQLALIVFTTVCFFILLKRYPHSAVIPAQAEAVFLAQSVSFSRVRAIQLLLFYALPVQSLNLIINLKRGPWIGVFISLLTVLLMFRKKLIAPFILVTVTIFLLSSSIQKRLGESYEHFVITGGRKIIWDIGFELAATYPLGIGLTNSPFLQKFSDDIPKELKHFHNNFINILVETGSASFCIYLIWISSILLHCFKKHQIRKQIIAFYSPLFLLGAAILSWQIAGIFEYNAGDKEILLVVFLIIGIIGALTQAVSDSRQQQNLP